MFSQITTEINICIENLEETIKYFNAMRESEVNPNMFTEYGGRIIGISEALAEIQKAKLNINDVIIDILKNTTDGNYAKKLDILVDENEVLREKIELLENDLEKYSSQNIARKKQDNKELHNAVKELSDEEIDNKIMEEVIKYEEIMPDIPDDEDE